MKYYQGLQGRAIEFNLYPTVDYAMTSNGVQPYAGMLSLSSCKKEKVTSLAGTRWGTKSSLEYKYVLAFPSERDVRFEKL